MVDHADFQPVPLHTKKGGYAVALTMPSRTFGTLELSQEEPRWLLRIPSQFTLEMFNHNIWECRMMVNSEPSFTVVIKPWRDWSFAKKETTSVGVASMAVSAYNGQEMPWFDSKWNLWWLIFSFTIPINRQPHHPGHPGASLRPPALRTTLRGLAEERVLIGTSLLYHLAPAPSARSGMGDPGPAVYIA